MSNFIKKNKTYIILLISIIVIVSERIIVNYNFSDLKNEILSVLPEGAIKIFYGYFFRVWSNPVVQGLSLSLIFIIFIYFISVILYLIARIIKVKIQFTDLLESYILSYFLVLVVKTAELICLLITKKGFSDISIYCISMIIQMALYCRLIKKYAITDKINRIIYNIVVMAFTIMINVGIILISRISG